MSVDQAMRAEVYLALETIHGKDVANAIMEMLPPAGVPELATKQDLALMSAELRTEFAELRTELKGEMAGLRTELKGEMAALGERMERLLREQTSRYIGWLLGVAGVGVAAAGAIAGLA
ncbi:MAG TPA: hypothetical protein VI916_03925 [Acidimicrobiia bacterium]|nr:hypothetical protein [Acidimicrobiia bacterium]